MIKLFTCLATPALLLAATAGIAGEPTRSFVHEGRTYVYDAIPQNDGGTVLAGIVRETGAKFRLKVRNGQVRGHADRQPVSFPVSKTRGAAAGAVVPSAAMGGTTAAD